MSQLWWRNTHVSAFGAKTGYATIPLRKGQAHAHCNDATYLFLNAGL